MFADAKAAYRARNALALLIEQDLQLARWLAGLHGVEARRDVSELVSSMVETGHMLPLLEDRLLTIIEASQVTICDPEPHWCDCTSLALQRRHMKRIMLCSKVVAVSCQHQQQD